MKTNDILETRFTFSSNIIDELSEKIPSNIIALNELIKNSYDAGSSFVEIALSSKEKKLTITDDGIGMNLPEINTLFHIAKTNKVYGKVNKDTNRRTQGSKGLGFLSVFKFGRKVYWQTYKNEGLKFEVDLDDAASKEDITQQKIPIQRDPSIPKGTSIAIDIDEYNLTSLKEYLLKDANNQKLLASFSEKKFEIRLKIDEDKNFTSQNTDFSETIELNKQLFQIKYDSSEKQSIDFFHNNLLVHSEHYPMESKGYEIKLHLVIFHLPSHGKKKIPPLYYNPQNDLTPLIYINSNLFNNFELFDPNIMKNIKTKYVLNQMIGTIEITSESQFIDFNSDRTKFVQNSFTDGIIEFLRDINIKIQTVGSEMKKYLMDFDIIESKEISRNRIPVNLNNLRDFIKPDFYFKENVKIDQNKDEILFSLFGKTAIVSIVEDDKVPTPTPTPDFLNSPLIPKGDDSQSKTIPSIIKLKNESIDVNIPSKQINTLEYVESAKDSNGDDIDLQSIQVFYNECELETKILPSIGKVEKSTLCYKYTDKRTGLVQADLKINFVSPTASIVPHNNGKLIYINANEDYLISFNPIVDELINQLNELEYQKYLTITACALRTLFDLSVRSIKQSKKSLSPGKNIKYLSDQVKHIITCLNKNNAYMTEIDDNVGCGYLNLINTLSDINFFTNVINQANLGAHSGNLNLTKEDIEGIGKKAGIFVTIANEIVTNPKIK